MWGGGTIEFLDFGRQNNKALLRGAFIRMNTYKSPQGIVEGRKQLHSSAKKTLLPSLHMLAIMDIAGQTSTDYTVEHVILKAFDIYYTDIFFQKRDKM